MTDALATKSQSASTGVGGRLFVLELSGDRIHSMNPDGTDRKIIVTDCHLPDGIAVDVEAGHIYWTNMGIPYLDDGSIERADLDGSNRKVIVPQGITFTPKQLHLEKESGKLYWCDREGMRVMRANLDGTNVETLVKTGEGDDDRRDPTKWCVGITVDSELGQIYWTQKGGDNSGRGRIFRAALDIPEGQDPASRTDIETWFDDLPEPIDLELDAHSRVMYWTDRGNPPQGNTVNRAPIDTPPSNGRTPELLVGDLMEGIGVALDIRGDRLFATDLGGSLYAAKLDGSEKRTLLFAQGNLSGVAYAEIPSEEK
jgi:sugar lactone lactonase YvrE